MERNDRGFTLVEILAVLIVLGVLFSTVAYKFDVFSNAARSSSVLLSVEELNSREKMVWTNIKISDDGYIDDAILIGLMDYDLGRLKWVNGPSSTGGTVATDGGDVVLVRSVSTRKEPAKWSQ